MFAKAYLYKRHVVVDSAESGPPERGPEVEFFASLYLSSQESIMAI
jgi:hypothetical protein